LIHWPPICTERIGVGIVGANPDEGWARLAHVPALAALPDLELVAVATSRAQSARASAERIGVRHAFTDAADLAQHPDVDLVVVAVKVPMHDTAVRAAIDAGKAVLLRVGAGARCRRGGGARPARRGARRTRRGRPAGSLQPGHPSRA